MNIRGDAVLAWLHSYAPFSEAIDVLAVEQLSFWIVGGAIRDYYLGSGAPPVDLDIALSGGAKDLDRRLQGLRHRINRHGNRRYWLPNGCVIDVIEPARFYGAEDSVESMLRRFDVSVNAVAVEYPTGQVLDPIGGLADCRDRSARLPKLRWETSRGFEAAHLLARAARCILQNNLDLIDVSRFRGLQVSLAGVDWAELERLNHSSRAEIDSSIRRVARYPLVSSRSSLLAPVADNWPEKNGYMPALGRTANAQPGSRVASRGVVYG